MNDKNCKCKFCDRYDDRRGCCKLNCSRKYTIDEVHECDFSDRSMGCFHSILATLKEVSYSLSNIEGAIGRCINTDKAVELLNKFVEVRNLADDTIKDIQERPDDYRKILDGLGDCGNCKHLDRTKSGLKHGYHVYGECPYAPTAYNGEIHADSWRGCAKWERV